ncbi:MAG: glycosyltransferase [Dehalococcoidia bacterium]|nr:MAG: glycosyltransferase [Dehalococcoidia bacterium]
MNDLLVSIVMPLYQSNPKYFQKSLSSIINQTYDNLELMLIIDKKDKDIDAEIFNIIEDFKDDHRIRMIVRTKKKGYCSALNNGIRKSSGFFIARLDSDDYCEPNRIERQMDMISDFNLDLVGTWTIVIDENGKKLGELRTPISNQSIRSQVMLHNPFVHSSIIFSRSVVNKIGLYNTLFEGAEDYEFYLRVISKGYLCSSVPEFLTFLRESPNSIMRGRKWIKTRKSYFMAKCEGVTKLGYINGLDLLYTLFSLSTFFITPKNGSIFKKKIGWYRPTPS